MRLQQRVCACVPDSRIRGKSLPINLSDSIAIIVRTKIQSGGHKYADQRMSVCMYSVPLSSSLCLDTHLIMFRFHTLHCLVPPSSGCALVLHDASSQKSHLRDFKLPLGTIFLKSVQFMSSRRKKNYIGKGK